jgi:predicted ATPase
MAFAPLTVIVGCNNTGKSTILQSLLALRQTIRDPAGAPRLVTNGDVDLGGFYDIAHRKGDRRSRTITIEIQRDPQDRRMEPPKHLDFRESTRLSLTFAFNKRANRILIHRVSLADDNGEVFSSNESGDWEAYGIPAATRKYLALGYHNFLPRLFITPESYAKLSSSAGEKSEQRVFDSAMTAEIQSYPWANLFREISRIPPNRSHVPFYGGLGERERSESGRGEELLRILSSEARIGKKQGDTLLKAVNVWMKRFGTLSNIRPRKLDDAGHIRSLLADNPGGASNINVAAMGEGISQLLPIVATALRSAPYSCLLVEQPEIHLHPALQAELADLFIAMVNKGKRQIVLETHSEHLLLRLRRRIAEGKIASDKVSVLYVEKSGGSSSVRRLSLSGNGHFTDWPEGFFDDAYKEALALAMAQPVQQANNVGPND